MLLFQRALYPRGKKLLRAFFNSGGAFGRALLGMAVEIPLNPTSAHIDFPSGASAKPKQTHCLATETTALPMGKEEHIHLGHVAEQQTPPGRDVQERFSWTHTHLLSESCFFLSWV